MRTRNRNTLCEATLFLKHGERHEPLIKKSGVYFVKAQVVHEVKGAAEVVMHDKSQQISCIRAEGLQISRVRAEQVQNSQISCMWVKRFSRKYQESCVEVEKQSSSKLNNAVAQPVLEDPVEDDRISAETGAGMMPAPCEPSEIEKTKHDLTYIPFQPWCTSCVKGKALAEPHKRIERITEDSELPTDQHDYHVLKDVAASDGLKVLSMYVKLFGYGTSVVVETKGATDTFAVPWVMKMRNGLGLSDSILQCDPEPSLMMWAEGAKSKRPERTVIRSCPRRSHQSNAAVDIYQKRF